MKAFLNASEVARLLNVDRATVTRWVKKGVIKGVIRPEQTQIGVFPSLLRKSY